MIQVKLSRQLAENVLRMLKAAQSGTNSDYLRGCLQALNLLGINAFLLNDKWNVECTSSAGSVTLVKDGAVTLDIPTELKTVELKLDLLDADIMSLYPEGEHSWLIEAIGRKCQLELRRQSLMSYEGKTHETPQG